ncbi:MAG: hypothetical protein GXP62_12805 [Oligoflexia bacterium]|nr:hypothetical protein [Oligoflexia bacterium]
MPCILLLTLFACNPRHDSNTDTDTDTASEDPVTVQGGDPEGFTQVSTLFMSLVSQTWDPAADNFTQAAASLFAVEFKAPVWVPFPSSTDVDVCWKHHAIELAGDQVDLGDQLEASIDGRDITLTAYGRNYTATLKGDDALAAAVPGAAVSLDGQDTSFVVPGPMTTEDLAGSVADLAQDSVLHLRWTPSDIPSFVEVQAIYHYDSGIWCALEDDGSADIDLRDVAEKAETISVSHVSRGTFDHTALGKTFVDIEQRVTMALP